MQDGAVQIVVLKTAAMFLVILPGWWAARRGWLGAGVGSAMSRIVVDLALPALILTQMLRTVTPASLREGWRYPLLMAAVLALASLAGHLVAGRCAVPARRRTFRFLVATPNWIYLPLPIVQALYGEAGVSAILLGNVGVQAMLWTYNLWLLRGGLRPAEALRHLFTNAGLLATAAGIGLALVWPEARTVALGDDRRVALLPAVALYQALETLGLLTIPLSLLAIGMQLGALPVRFRAPERDLALALVARLALGPLLWWGFATLLASCGLALSDAERRILALVALMPVALSCSVFTERFGGDTAFAAQTIFWSTLAGLVTVPLGFALLAA